MDGLGIALALHVLGVVIWFGGVSMATSIALTAIRKGEMGDDWPKAFQTIEHRFVWQARTAVIIVGLTGLYMLWGFDLWDRFESLTYWWMHAMVCVWLLFAIILFIGEPLVLHRYFERWASANPRIAFCWLQRVHWVLLTLGVVTILGAVAGSHGVSIFG